MKRFITFLTVIVTLCINSVAQNFTEYDRKVFNEGTVLTPDDLFFAREGTPYSIEKPCRVYSIHNEGGETILTLSYSIYFDSQWVHIGKGLEIVDSLTNDVYKVRGYADGYPMGKLLIVKGCKGKNILIRMRFPKLKRNVETICLYECIHPDDIKPSNNRVDDELIAKNIKVADYRVKRSPKKRK